MEPGDLIQRDDGPIYRVIAFDDVDGHVTATRVASDRIEGFFLLPKSGWAKVSVGTDS